jgi:putative flavoprotein involved in K+ transport
MSDRAHDVVVIGGGQAGLAIGHQLARRGLGFTILDAAGGPAAAWRDRWDRSRTGRWSSPPP